MKYRALFWLSTALASGLLLYSAGSGPVQAQSDSQVSQILRLNNLGVAWLDQLKFPQAVEEFQRLVQSAPRFVPAHVNLGIALFYDQKYDQAETALQRALELDPDQIQAHYLQGLHYRNRDEGDKALEEFKQVYRQDPDDPTVNYFLGNLYRARREFEVAIGYFKRCIELEPYNKSAYYALSQSLLRSGKRDEGRQQLLEFQRLNDLSGTETVGLDYREQGRYAVAIDLIPERYLPGREDVPASAAVRVRFEDAAVEWGLDFRHGGPGQIASNVASVEGLGNKAPILGSGVAAADYDSDSRIDLYFANAAPDSAVGALYRNRGPEGFENVTRKAGLDHAGKTMAALWGDYDNDGDPDLYLINYGPNRLYRNNGDGTFTDVTRQSGTGDASWGLSGVFADSDHDGDLDIVVANFIDPTANGDGFPEGFPGADNAHLRNNGDGTFTDVASQSGLAGASRRSLAVIASDFDSSRDIDFYFLNQGAANQLFSNLRDGTFRDVAPRTGADLVGVQSGTLSMGDLDNDTEMDLLVTDRRGGGRALFYSRDGHHRSEDLSGAVPNVQGAHLFDFDNDGDLDLLLTAAPDFSGSAASRLQLLRNQDGRFVDATRDVGLDAFSNRPFRGSAVGDFDGDGDLDVVISVNGGQPLALRNQGGNRNNWIAVEAKGVNSNRGGVGTKVEIRSGGFHRKSEVYAGDGRLSQSAGRVHFGLGGRRRVDFLRLRWPGGVLQSELAPTVNSVVAVEELDRKGTSCPILYVFNGKGYEFVTDFLGGSAFGYQLKPHVFNYPDSDEYIKLPREQVGLKDGRIALSLNNQLEEVIFFDTVELLAVDHPADFEVFPDEKLLPGPPYLPFRLLAVSDTHSLVAARDGQGRDLLESLAAIDRRYAEIIEDLPFKGYARPWQMVLDLGSVPENGGVLLMHAWIDYADSSGNLAASQAGLELQPPRLQVRDRAGRWVTVSDRMGFPAGLPKTMTVDLSGIFSSHSREIRILSNMRIHWDRIWVGSAAQRQDLRVERLSPVEARLDFYGFPEFSSPDGLRPKQYDYRRVSPIAPWKVHIGDYTRYGEVTPLLRGVDDMFVITRSGDRIQVFFDVTNLPPLHDGWVRDYLVYTDGFGKDMDVNSAFSDTVDPLPFHGMSAFPYPEGEHYPDTPIHRRYRDEWNTRRESRWVY